MSDKWNRLIVEIISVVLTLTVCQIPAKVVMAEETIGNPRIVEDSTTSSGHKETWDCIWFGSYPQTEIVDKPETSGAYEENNEENVDYEVDISLYETLKNATGWGPNGDILINGVKYRRLRKSDTTLSDQSKYNWDDPDKYHYFRYEKIKWRVLNISEGQALLLADKALDNQRFNALVNRKTTWATSTIRSWLNGYGASSNARGLDYSNMNFIDSAFKSVEKRAIVPVDLDNRTTGESSEKYGGENTRDKIYLLASYDMINSDKAASYGFFKNDFSTSYTTKDKAGECKCTCYTKTMGAYYHDSICQWWLRSPGTDDYYTAFVYWSGNVESKGYPGAGGYFGVRPALNINLSSTDSWSYAGTVCSDGTVYEEGGGSGTGGDGKMCTVTYNANGGTNGPDTELIYQGGDLTISSIIPDRPGYHLWGWGKTTDGSLIYQTGNIITVDDDLTLYAIWDGIFIDDITYPTTNTTSTNAKSNILIKKITLDGVSNNIVAGKKIKLTATVLPKTATNRKLKWSTSNKKFATVTQSGLVKIAKKAKPGKTVKITATATDGSGKKQVWVIRIMKGAVKKITVKGYKKTLKAGKTMKLKAVVKTTKGKPVNKKLKWTTSNKKYATVTQTGKVKAKPAGKGKTVKIKVMSTDGTNKSVVKKIKIK